LAAPFTDRGRDRQGDEAGEACGLTYLHEMPKTTVAKDSTGIEEKMKKARMLFLVVTSLWFVFQSPPSARALVDLRPDEDTPFEDRDRLDAGSRDNREIGFDIREDIKRGQEFLKSETAGYSFAFEEKRATFLDKRGRKRERIVSEKIVKPNFLLAVEDLKERRIREVRLTDKGCVTKGFEVTKCRDNGVGSRFEVAYPENMVILALRTMVRSGKKGHREVVYTPYSPEIDTWQVRQAGLTYLTRQIELAHKDLRARNVRLCAFDRLLADTTPAEVSLVLSIIEHIDPVRFNHCREGEETDLVREVLTIIGANTTDAYAYSKSPAGARGLFQLIPDTYKKLQAKYPRAGLKKGFVSGCSDHVNAAKASLLLFDSDLSGLPKGWLWAARRNVRAIGSYLAAAYNCGAKRVGESARACGDEWTCRLPEETKIYLKKFDVVWDLRKALDR